VEFIALVGVGIGLAMDAFAVSLSAGMELKRVHFHQAAAIALAFGFFQFLMPVIGFFCGTVFYRAIQAVDHWVVLILLMFLGGKMLLEGISVSRTERRTRETRHESTSREEVPYGPEKTTLSVKELLLQALATSIDALAVGVSLAVMNEDIFFCAPVIGIITALICFPAVFIGKRIGGLLGSKAKIFGGLILITIGVRVFAQHVATATFALFAFA
jgi:putative Mn2+ efflux pump MntP